MRRFRALSSAAALVALTTGAPAQAAGYGVTCVFAAATDAVAGQGQVTGVLAGALYTAHAAGKPARGRLDCHVKVNGALQPGARVAGNGAGLVSASGVATFTSTSAADYVELCVGGSVSGCAEARVFELAPPLVRQGGPDAPCAPVPTGRVDDLPNCPPYHLLPHWAPRATVIWVTFHRW